MLGGEEDVDVVVVVVISCGEVPRTITHGNLLHFCTENFLVFIGKSPSFLQGNFSSFIRKLLFPCGNLSVFMPLHYRYQYYPPC